MAGKAKPAFAAVPLRALVDGRILPSHLKVLAVIAAHDHMSLPREKGAGCYVSNQRLAGLTKLNYSVVASIQTDLERWGYLLRERRNDDRRQKTSRVVYSDEDTTAFKRMLDSEPAPKEVCPETNYFTENLCPKANDLPKQVCPKPNNASEIVCLSEEESSVKSETCSNEYIPLNGETDSVKQGNKFSETARSKELIAAAYEKIESSDDNESIVRFLAITEREVRGFPSIINDRLVAAIEKIQEDATDINIAGHALRVIEAFTQVAADSEEVLGNGRDEAPSAPLTEQDTKFLARIKTTWADVSDDPDRRTLLAQRSGFSPSVIAAVAHGHTRLTSSDIRKLRDACVSI